MSPEQLSTVKQESSVIPMYSVFEIFFGSKMFNGANKPRNRLVEMYHASTPNSVKQHVIENMADPEGHIHVLISTVAFGMGVNCKKVRSIIHFGPSKSVEMYIQECGRGGRDGEPSACVLLYNGLLSSHCDYDMKSYIQSDGRLRKVLMLHFCQSATVRQTLTPLHKCCKNCLSICHCGDCPELWNLESNGNDFPDSYFQKSEHKPEFTRVVRQDSKSVLKEKLLEVKREFHRNTASVSSPVVLLEFNEFHISQGIANCHSLFTLKDVYHLVEIWRTCYAVVFLKVIGDIFNDIEFDFSAIEVEANESGVSDWSLIRDDSTLLDFFDTQHLEDLEISMDTDAFE